METMAFAVTVRVVVPETAPNFAEITEEPAATAVANPVAASMVAAAGVADAQGAVFVRSCDVPSEYVPVAVNCCVWPAATDGVAGVIAIAVRVAAVTDTVTFVVTEFSVAEMTALPGPAAVTTPPAVTVATVGLPEVHVTEPVTSFVEASEYVPFAVNCCV
jgi:hypothetical protein